MTATGLAARESSEKPMSFGDEKKIACELVTYAQKLTWFEK